MLTIRDAEPHDLPAITALYNAVIPETTVVWSEQLQSLAERQQWYERQQAEGFPVLVAVDDASAAVIGFAAYGHFRGAGCWPGYRFTVEHTIYVDAAHGRRGVGAALMRGLIERARSRGIHVMVGAVDGANQASLEFHARLGFEIVGRLPEVGRKFDRWLDLILVQKILDESGRTRS